MRYELTDHEWAAIKSMLPNKPRGVARVNDHRVLNGIFWVSRSGAPWRDLPDSFGPYTTCYNRFVRWRRAGVWGKIMNALAGTHDAAVQMIDTSIVRVHQHGACITRNRRQSMGRSRGGLTSKNFLPEIDDFSDEKDDNRYTVLGSAIPTATLRLQDRPTSQAGVDYCAWQITNAFLRSSTASLSFSSPISISRIPEYITSMSWTGMTSPTGVHAVKPFWAFE